MLFFFLLTDGFQFVPKPLMLFGLNLFGKDYALMFIVAIFLSYLITGRLKTYHSDPVKKWIYLFYAFLLVAIVIDLRINPSIPGFILVVRQYLFLLCFFIFNDIEISLWERIGKTLLKITVFQCVLCLLQLIVGVPLLTMGGVTETPELGFRWFRYTNLPYFIYLLVFVVILSPRGMIKYKNNILLLFLVAIIFTLTRTLILGLFITMFVAIITNVLATQKKMIPLLLFIVLLTLPIIGTRVASSFSDIGNTFSTNFEASDDQNLTFTWRMALAAERTIYVASSTKMQFFGLGFIHENDLSDQLFLIGHLNDEGIPVQLDQGDIAWPNLFLRLGFLGTFLYIMVAVSLGRFFYKHKRNFVAGAAFLYLIYSLIISFASNNVSAADFYIMLFALYFYVRQVVKVSPAELNYKTMPQ